MRTGQHGMLGLAFAILSLLAVGCAPMSAQVVPLGDQSAVADQPEWKVGDRWVFQQRSGLWQGPLQRVVTEASLTGYVVRVDSKGDSHGRYRRTRWQYLTPDLDVMAWVEDGEITSIFSPPLPMFKWPARAGLRWDSGTGPPT